MNGGSLKGFWEKNLKIMSEAIQLLSDFQNWFVGDWKSEISLLRGLILPFSVAGFGAFFGASAAAKNSRRLELSRRRVTGAEATYEAALVAAAICNAAIGLKRQHIQKLRKDFESEKSRIATILFNPTVRKVIETSYDLQQLNSPKFITSELLPALARAKGVSALDTMQANALIYAANEVAALNDRRNQWIHKYKEDSPAMSDTTKVNIYFGFSQKGGTIDTNYSDFISGISDLLDDTIYHSKELHVRLIAKCFELRRNLEKADAKLLAIHYVDFSPSVEAGLMPDPESYLDWREPVKIIKKPWYVRQRAHEKMVIEKLSK